MGRDASTTSAISAVRRADEAGPAAPALDGLEALGCAAVLVDFHGMVLGISRSAEHAFGSDLLLRSGRIELVDAAASSEMKELIRSAASTMASKEPRPPFVVRRRNKRPIIIRALHLPVRGLEQAIIVLNDLEAAPEIPDSDVLVRLFGLTPAEARFAARIAAGRSLKEAAEELRISIGTARNYVKATFAKTGTKRQAELVALLWRATNTGSCGRI